MARSPHLLALASVALLAAGCGGSGSRDIDSLLADVMSQAGQARAERILAEHGRAYIKPLSSIVTGRDIEKARRDHGIHGDPAKLRLPAILALGMIAQHASLANSEAAVAAQPLLAVLREKGKRELRIEAARALGSFSQLSGPANDLVLLLREDDGELADAAVDSLARTALRSVHRIALPPSPGAGAVTTKDWRRLEERLGSSDDDIRLDAVREMAASRDPRAEPVLRQRVASDRSRDVRYAAIRACRVLAEEEPEGAHARTLRAALPTTFSKDDDSRVVLVAAEILADSQPDRVGAFLARIGQARQKAKEALLADARSEAYDEATRADAVTALTHLPGEDRDGLLATFLDGTRSEGARVRRAAAAVLAVSDSVQAREALAQAMKDEDALVSLIAAQALGRRGDPAAVTFLVGLLSGAEPKVRLAAADALGTLGAEVAPSLVGHLEAWLQSGEGSERVAWGIVFGLGRIATRAGSRAAVARGAILQAARSPHPTVRRAAVEALTSFHGEEVMAALAGALSDQDEAVAWYAGRSLEAHGSEAVPALIAAVGMDASRAMAARCLGAIGDAAALAPLTPIVVEKGGGAPADVVWALGAILRRRPDAPGAEAAREALAAVSQDAAHPEAARAAAYALRAAPIPR